MSRKTNKKMILRMPWGSFRYRVPVQLRDSKLPQRLRDRRDPSGVEWGDISLRPEVVSVSEEYILRTCAVPEGDHPDLDSSPLYFRALRLERPKLLELYQEGLWGLGCSAVLEIMKDCGILERLPVQDGEGHYEDFGLDVLGYERRADELRQMIEHDGSETLKEMLYRIEDMGPESLPTVIPVGEVHTATIDKNTLEVKVLTGDFPSIHASDLVNFAVRETEGGSKIMEIPLEAGSLMPVDVPTLSTFEYPDAPPAIFPGMWPPPEITSPALHPQLGSPTAIMFARVPNPGHLFPAWEWIVDFSGIVVDVDSPLDRFFSGVTQIHGGEVPKPLTLRHPAEGRVVRKWPDFIADTKVHPPAAHIREGGTGSLRPMSEAKIRHIEVAARHLESALWRIGRMDDEMMRFALNHGPTLSALYRDMGIIHLRDPWDDYTHRE